MKKWSILENILVEKLVFWWKWFSRLKSTNKDLDWKALFITWWVIPGSIVNLRILKSRKDYIETQCMEVIKKSPIEKTHPNNIYWNQAWSMWVNIPYEEQLKIKEWQVLESVFHIRKLQSDLIINPIVSSPIIDWYRNKIEFSFWKYISQKENIRQEFNVWFHKQWEFSKIQDFDWTILIDENTNKIYKEIKDFAKNTWLPSFDQFMLKWFFRHIVLRKAYFTNQLMIIFSINHKFFEKIDDNTKLIWNFKDLESIIIHIKDFFKNLIEKYPEIKSVYLSLNDSKADVAIWELEIIYWKKFIEEKLLWITFNISPKSFFQTNSSWAEKLYSEVLNQVISQNNTNLKLWTVLDLYWWTWTIWMIFAKNAEKVISVELVKDASIDWKANAIKNGIDNIEFINAKVEDFLWEYLKSWEKADLLIIDPPRAWMHPDALPDILKFNTKNIIYVSCNPATLSRDLDYILKNSNYKIIQITPVDMFPHTPHIETIVKLEKK